MAAGAAVRAERKGVEQQLHTETALHKMTVCDLMNSAALVLFDWVYTLRSCSTFVQ
jgi:hypothetical protein